MSIRVRSFSKINLGLAIGPVRPDGFHALTTLYQTLGAHDVLTLTAEPLAAGQANRIELSSNDRRVPLDGRNTIWKILSLALTVEPYARHSWSVRVHIDKRLPVQGGLGGGSANAAAALLALEQESGLALSGGERLRIGAAVGSDVPLFLLGGAVLGLGRGEEVYPMPDLWPTPAGLPRDAGSLEGPALGQDSLDRTCRDESSHDQPAKDQLTVVLALPDVGVSTPLAFREWDRQAATRKEQLARPDSPQDQPALTAGSSLDRLGELSRALASALCESHYSSGVFQEDLAGHLLSALVRTGIRNDFEEVVFRQHPFLGTIKRALLGLSESDPTSVGSGSNADVLRSSPDPSHARDLPVAGIGGQAIYAALTGSGSALFGIYLDTAAAAQAEARLQQIGVKSMRTCLLTRSAYWQQMLVAASEPDFAVDGVPLSADSAR